MHRWYRQRHSRRELRLRNNPIKLKAYARQNTMPKDGIRLITISTHHANQHNFFFSECVRSIVDNTKWSQHHRDFRSPIWIFTNEWLGPRYDNRDSAMCTRCECYSGVPCDPEKNGSKFLDMKYAGRAFIRATDYDRWQTTIIIGIVHYSPCPQPVAR